MNSSDKKSIEQLKVVKIENLIYLIRGTRVMLDSDLADLYGVETRTLMQAVKRNIERFPEDFMFQFTKEEFNILKSQNVISSQWGGRRKLPYAFTEHGAIMLASVLRSKPAVEMSIYIVRAFNQLRQAVQSYEELRREIDDMKYKHNQDIVRIYDILSQLVNPPIKRKRIKGFDTPD